MIPNIDKDKTPPNPELTKLQKLFEEQGMKLEQLQNSQSMFLKNLSQNIRIPLNGIVGMIDVMMMTQVTQEQTEYLDVINNYGSSLINIVNDILDYSQIIAGDLDLDKRYFLPSKLQAEIDLAFRLQIEGKGLDFQIIIDPKIPPQLFGDLFRIKQVVSNLINNSLKYTKEGNISLELLLLNDPFTKENNEELAKIRFLVKDSGYGISEEKHKKLLLGLNQSQNESAISNDGIGLGLSISQALLNLFGSSIQFTSTPNKGSEFWFDLDLKFKKSKILPSFISPKESDEKLSILLVEDNILNQKFAVATLVKCGHQVVVAENGKLAYDKYKEEKFDLILMDIQMPIMDGVQATINIRAHEKKKKITKPIKIVAVTAYALDYDRDRCMDAGMDKFLAKPFKPDQLISIINNLDFE
ncbi:MAG: response regulator [Bacteroidales bacterium]|nr:response regulator [Bacteroidales bacterium]